MSINTFKVIITASKEFNNYKLLEQKANKVLRNKSNITVVTDSYMGQRYANYNKLGLEQCNPDWKKFGKKAGKKNDIEMANKADALIVFWDGKAKTTKHLIHKAQNLGLPVRVFDFDGNIVEVKTETEEVTEVLANAAEKLNAKYIKNLDKMSVMSRPAINQGVGVKEFSRASGLFYSKTGYILKFNAGYDMDETKYAKLKYTFEENFLNELEIEIKNEKVVDEMIRSFENIYSYQVETPDDDELQPDFLDTVKEEDWQKKISWNEDNSEYESDFSKLVGNWDGRLRSYRDDEPSYFKEFRSSQLPELRLAQKNYFHSFDKKTTIKAPKAGDMTLREMYTLGLVRG